MNTEYFTVIFVNIIKIIKLFKHLFCLFVNLENGTFVFILQ